MKKNYPPEWMHMTFIQTNIKYSPTGSVYEVPGFSKTKVNSMGLHRRTMIRAKEISEKGCFTFYWGGYLYIGDTISEVIQKFYEEFEDDRHLVVMKKFVTYIDPPEGWLYGFPKVYDAEEGVLIRDWLEENGYPKNKAQEFAQWCRFWQKELED